MPLFRSTSNLNPDFNDPINDLPIDEITKAECKRRLSFKKSFFTWSTQKDFLDKNKFVFDSNTVIKSRHNSLALKSSKCTYSGSAVNYDESDNEYSSDSEGDLNKDGYFSMEDIDNISALKKYPKNKNNNQLSESTLIYSSNTNTINTVSLEFKTKLISNNDINYGFDENHINEEEEDTTRDNSEKSGNSTANTSGNSSANTENSTGNNDDNNNTSNNVNISDIIDEINNINIDNIDDIDKINLADMEDEESDESDNENNENEEEKDKLSDYPNSSYTVPKSIFKTNSTTKKTVTFCDDVVIIEPKKPRKGKNLFKRAILKIMKKKDDDKIEE